MSALIANIKSRIPWKWLVVGYIALNLAEIGVLLYLYDLNELAQMWSSLVDGAGQGE